MRGTTAMVAALGLLAGCGLERSGLLGLGGDPPGGSVDAGSVAPGPADATSPVPPSYADGSVSSDSGAGVADAQPAPASDAATGEANDGASEADDAACPPPETDAALSIVTPIAPPPKIDGDLTEWGCGPWTRLDSANAGFIRPGGQAMSGQFAVRWDPAGIYLAAHVVVPSLQGDDLTTPYHNDAVELYVSGDSPRTGDFSKTSHQYIVDWHNLAVDYGSLEYPPNQSTSNPPNLTSQVKKVADGWQVEMAVAWKALVNGKPPGPGATIGLDVAFDDGDGFTLTGQLLGTVAPHASSCGCKTCCCGQANDLPDCDTLAFATATLR